VGKRPFSKYQPRTIAVIRWLVVPVAAIGQILVVIDKAKAGPMQQGLFGLPNIVWIISSMAFLFLMGWMFFELAKEKSFRNVEGGLQQGDAPDASDADEL
jgi:hypothetical protein